MGKAEVNRHTDAQEGHNAQIAEVDEDDIMADFNPEATSTPKGNKRASVGASTSSASRSAHPTASPVDKTLGIESSLGDVSHPVEQADDEAANFNAAFVEGQGEGNDNSPSEVLGDMSYISPSSTRAHAETPAPETPAPHLSPLNDDTYGEIIIKRSRRVQETKLNMEVHSSQKAYNRDEEDDEVATSELGPSSPLAGHESWDDSVMQDSHAHGHTFEMSGGLNDEPQSPTPQSTDADAVSAPAPSSPFVEQDSLDNSNFEFLVPEGFEFELVRSGAQSNPGTPATVKHTNPVLQTPAGKESEISTPGSHMFMSPLPGDIRGYQADTPVPNCPTPLKAGAVVPDTPTPAIKTPSLSAPAQPSPAAAKSSPTKAANPLLRAAIKGSAKSVQNSPVKSRGVKRALSEPAEEQEVTGTPTKGMDVKENTPATKKGKDNAGMLFPTLPAQILDAEPSSSQVRMSPSRRSGRRGPGSPKGSPVKGAETGSVSRGEVRQDVNTDGGATEIDVMCTSDVDEEQELADDVSAERSKKRRPSYLSASSSLETDSDAEVQENRFRHTVDDAEIKKYGRRTSLERRSECLKNEESISHLQAQCRRVLVSAELEKQIQAVITAQRAARRFLVRLRTLNTDNIVGNVIPTLPPVFDKTQMSNDSDPIDDEMEGAYADGNISSSSSQAAASIVPVLPDSPSTPETPKTPKPPTLGTISATPTPRRRAPPSITPVPDQFKYKGGTASRLAIPKPVSRVSQNRPKPSHSN